MTQSPNHPITCPTARLLALLSTHQKAGRPCHWRASRSRIWLSTGDPKAALVDAALRFPHALRKE